jgi:hypothetical protein
MPRHGVDRRVHRVKPLQRVGDRLARRDLLRRDQRRGFNAIELPQLIQCPTPILSLLPTQALVASRPGAKPRPVGAAAEIFTRLKVSVIATASLMHLCSTADNRRRSADRTRSCPRRAVSPLLDRANRISPEEQTAPVPSRSSAKPSRRLARDGQPSGPSGQHVFPNPEALLRLAGAVLVEAHGEW